jgi:hypothetical protein
MVHSLKRKPLKMIHPNTELRYINDLVGYGVFATRSIPKGTIVYVKDSLEVVVTPAEYLMHSSEMQNVIEKFSYIDQDGNRIVSWDFAKYVNHCCNCNTMSTGYGFEIAIRDICEGEEITDEYGMFNMEYEMDLICSNRNCRQRLTRGDFDRHYWEWDDRVQPALRNVFEVEQPLLSLIDVKTLSELEEFVKYNLKYKSVLTLKHQPLAINGKAYVNH